MAGALGEKGRKQYGFELRETSKRDGFAAAGLAVSYHVDMVAIKYKGKTYEDRKSGGAFEDRN